MPAAGIPSPKPAATARSASRSKPTTIPTAISPFPGRRDRRRRRDPRRRRHRPRRPPEGRPDRFQRLAPAHPDAAAAVGSDARAQSAHGLGAGNHDSTARSGGAAFNNEFGRPNLTGYFRSFELPSSAPDTDARLRQADHAGRRPRRDRSRARCRSCRCAPGDAVIVLGGPAMLIGLGGGAASFGGLRTRAPKTSISPRCSATTRRWSAAARK